jgi:L-ascorbate metabolism protein UlaG (beta-lactamase superfamily)
MNITYYGHSCFGVAINGKNLLFDPFVSANSLAAKIDINQIPADYILISHGHEDHILDAERIAKRTQATVICNYEIGLWLERKGVTRILSMNIGGKARLDFGNVKCVVAQHSSSLPDGAYGGNPMGFVIESSETNFYYAGDTALTYDMKLIGDFRKIDFAFLPIGDVYTMSVDNAIIACDFIDCDYIIGMHYNTYEPIRIDTDDAVRKFSRAGKRLTLMEIGETIQNKKNIKIGKEWEKSLQ